MTPLGNPSGALCSASVPPLYGMSAPLAKLLLGGVEPLLLAGGSTSGLRAAFG